MTPKGLDWICEICRECFAMQTALLIHKVVAHKLKEHQRKLSHLLRREPAKQTEILYSSDSDCEYHIVTHVYKVPRNKTTAIETVVLEVEANLQSNVADIFCDEVNAIEPNPEPGRIRLGESNEIIPIANANDTVEVPYDNRAETCPSYICDYCDATYANKNTLKIHMHQVHLEQATVRDDDLKSSRYQHACSKCGKKMYNETYRRNHERHCFAHLCSYCGKHFKNSTNLGVHIMSHTKERPFACTLCDKAFLIKRSLLDHMNKHAGVRPYKCPYENCDKTFALTTGVRQHINTMHLARRFTCNYCQHRFSTKFQLHCHERTHTGEKPYKCGECSATFRLSSTFKKHRRVHTGERPYNCDICLKGFISSYNLKQHQKRQKKCIPPLEVTLVSAAESLASNE